MIGIRIHCVHAAVESQECCEFQHWQRRNYYCFTMNVLLLTLYATFASDGSVVCLCVCVCSRDTSFFGIFFIALFNRTGKQISEYYSSRILRKWSDSNSVEYTNTDFSCDAQTKNSFFAINSLHERNETTEGAKRHSWYSQRDTERERKREKFSLLLNLYEIVDDPLAFRWLFSLLVR